MGSFIKKAKKLFRRKGSSTTEEPLVVPLEEVVEDPATMTTSPEEEEEDTIVIVGAGIVGLVLALCLQKHCERNVEVYERADAFHDDVGAGMGMYPNGLRVIRDIDPDLLQQIRQAGRPYGVRRYERHDGTEVAVANEDALVLEEELQSIGIRRWRLQKILFQAVEKAGIRIHFSKELIAIEQKPTGGPVTLKFQDGTSKTAQLLLAADGARSIVRTLLLSSPTGDGPIVAECSPRSAAERANHHLKYTGVTCLMGTATVPREQNGLALPSSLTSKCHGAFYPTGETEQCFQFHFPTDEKDAQNALASWGNLTEMVGQAECDALKERLKQDGWDEKYIQPLSHVDKAIKIGFCTLEPALESFVFCQNRIVLLGDAAHPPVPYLGQGAQQGLEDAGTLALLLANICGKDRQQQQGKNNNKNQMFSGQRQQLEVALKIYNQLRMPRTEEILKQGKEWGKMQQKRAESTKYNAVREEKIKREIFYHESMPVLFAGVRHDYKEEVLKAVEVFQNQQQKVLPSVSEEVEETGATLVGPCQ